MSISSRGPSAKVERALQQLRQRIDAVAPGSKLPTYRSLMDELGMSQATIHSAVGVLEKEGLVERRPGSGLYSTRHARTKPVLLLCDTASFVGPSAFWEILLDALTAPYRDSPEGLVVAFTSANVLPRGTGSIEEQLPGDVWIKLKSRHYAGVMAVCVDERIPWECERFGNHVVGFGCPSHTMIRMGTLEICQLGVQELVRLGCNKIALYNAPHLDAREAFMAALSASGASECLVPPTVAFSLSQPQLGKRFRLIEHGFHEAHRLYGQGTEPKSRPDGVISVDDTFTQGFIMGLLQLGLAPGRDVEIASHVNAGSPTLMAWQDQIVSLRIDVRSIAEAMNCAIHQLARGQTPNRAGWEHSILMNELQGPLRTLLIRPQVKRKSRS